MVTRLEISPDGKTTFAFVSSNQSNGEEEGYIIKSMDGGNTWSKTDGQITGAIFVSKFAFGNNGNIYTALIQDNEKIGESLAAMTTERAGYLKEQITILTEM